MLLFFKIMLTEFIAEMGDKTQFMLIALSTKYKLRDIFLGTAFAILVLNGIAVLAGGLISNYIPTWVIRLIAASAFLFFAFTSLQTEETEDEEKTEKKHFSFAAFAVFSTFFVAELGDKTQLTAITFGANEGFQSAVLVWAACSIGLFAADITGVFICLLIRGKTPANFLNIIAFFIFMIFGILTLHEGLELFLPKDPICVFSITLIISIAFFIASIIRFIKVFLNTGTSK